MMVDQSFLFGISTINHQIWDSLESLPINKSSTLYVVDLWQYHTLV